MLIFTSLLLMPVALSYIGVGAKAAERALKIDNRDGGHGHRREGGDVAGDRFGGRDRRGLRAVQLHYQRQGLPLAQAYRNAVSFTGRVVGLVGITLAAGVVCRAWSPIKFQADMGILLTFMFLWNMLGALILIPALSHFLLRNIAPVPSKATERPAELVGAHP